MRRVLILLICLLPGLGSYAQTNYPVSLIPKELLAYASAVVRNQDITMEVKDLDNTIYHVKNVITVLNENGEDDAHIVVYYGRGRSIRNVKGVVYDELGKQIKKFSESDFKDQSAADGFSLFLGWRIKHYLPAINQYPYTIAYDYEIRDDQSLNIPDWYPNQSTGMAVENSSYTFTCKPDFMIRYKEANVPEKAVIGTTPAGLKTYTWKVSNLKANRTEPFSPNAEAFLTNVKIAPEKFEYEGIKGAFTNWQDLGKWIYDKLLTNRQFLPETTVAYIKSITADITDPKLKAKKIYEYMQSKTHYISVQVGIGGYQPFLAADVDKQSYGDCKALVNYTQSLLKAVNIDSYYCVVEAGDRKVSLLPDFASMNQGDHIILCMPFKNDTTWLECTSQKIPFGFLGDFTADRWVLACTPQGGKLMHTPTYPAQENTQTRTAEFTINDKGEIAGDMTTLFKGMQYENREYLVGESPVEQNKIIQKIYPINNLVINKLNLKQDKSLHPVTTETIKLEARDYGTVENGKFYFMINPVNRSHEAPKSVRNRRTDVYINDGFTDNDEIIYTLPAGYKLEKHPLNVQLDKPFGKYKATMTLKDGRLTYKRQLQILDGTYSKDQYQDLVDFYQTVADEDNYSVVLVKAD